MFFYPGFGPFLRMGRYGCLGKSKILSNFAALNVYYLISQHCLWLLRYPLPVWIRLQKLMASQALRSQAIQKLLLILKTHAGLLKFRQETNGLDVTSSTRLMERISRSSVTSVPAHRQSVWNFLIAAHGTTTTTAVRSGAARITLLLSKKENLSSWLTGSNINRSCHP